MVPRGVAKSENVDEQVEYEPDDHVRRAERPLYPCRSGMPKRSRYKKGAKHISQDGKHRRRVRKMTW